MAFGDFNISEYWDASANRPKLVSGRGINGKGYLVGTSGTTNLDGISNWTQDDIALFILDKWIKFSNTSAGSPAPTGSVLGNYLTSDFTASLGSTNYCDTSGGPITLTLPTNPTFGSVVALRDAAGTWDDNNVTVDPASLNIDGIAGPLVCNTTDANFDLVWRGGSVGWSIQFLVAPLTHRPSLLRNTIAAWDGAGNFTAIGRALATAGVASWGGAGTFSVLTSASAVTTWDPANKATHVALSGSNLIAALGASGVANEGVRGTRALTGSSAKRFEVTINSIGAGVMAIGIATSGTSLTSRIGADETTSAAGTSNGFVEGPGLNANMGFSFNAGDVIGVEAWAATGTSNGGFQIYVNGVWQNWVQSAPTGGDIFPAVSFGAIGDSVTANFGATAFVHPPSSGGVLAWNS